MKFTYVGDSASKQFTLSTGELCVLDKDVPREVPDELAALLENNPDFTNDRPFGPKENAPKADNTLPKEAPKKKQAKEDKDE